MRLGKKKEKDKDGEKEQCIDGIARLICSAKQSHPAPLRGKFIYNILLELFCILSESQILFNSLYRWNRMVWCQILPTVFAMANSCEKFPSCISWSSYRNFIEILLLASTQLIIMIVKTSQNINSHFTSFSTSTPRKLNINCRT